MYNMVRKYAISFVLFSIYTFPNIININTIVIITMFMHTHINNKISNSMF